MKLCMDYIFSAHEVDSTLYPCIVEGRIGVKKLSSFAHIVSVVEPPYVSLQSLYFHFLSAFRYAHIPTVLRKAIPRSNCSLLHYLHLLSLPPHLSLFKHLACVLTTLMICLLFSSNTSSRNCVVLLSFNLSEIFSFDAYSFLKRAPFL